MAPECHILIGRGVGMVGMVPEDHILKGGGLGMVPDCHILLGGGLGMVPDCHTSLGGRLGMVPDDHILQGGRLGMVPDNHRKLRDTGCESNALHVKGHSDLTQQVLNPPNRQQMKKLI